VGNYLLNVEGRLNLRDVFLEISLQVRLVDWVPDRTSHGVRERVRRLPFPDRMTKCLNPPQKIYPVLLPATTFNVVFGGEIEATSVTGREGIFRTWGPNYILCTFPGIVLF